MSDVDDEVPQLAVLLGRADDMRAVVYVRVLDLPEGWGDNVSDHAWSVEGTLRGPRCALATTLPTTARFRGLLPSSGEAREDVMPTAEAILVEPGYWSPELPNRYQLDLYLKAPAGRELRWSQLVGVRRLGHRDGAFRLDGRRYVPRAVCRPHAIRGGDPAALAGLGDARACAAALWVDLPASACCEAADRDGVMLVAQLPDHLRDAEATREAARLAAHPSVGFLVLGPQHLPLLPRWRRFRGTLQLGLSVDGEVPPPWQGDGQASMEGLDFLVGQLGNTLPHDGWRCPPPLPVLIRRSLAGEARLLSIEGARNGCDTLQADMAAWLAAGTSPAWEPAGYAV